MTDEMKEYISKTNKKHWFSTKMILRRAHDFEEDVKKEWRIKFQNCKFCTYLEGSLGASVLTNSTCAICGKPILNSSTNIDKLCIDCAKEYQLCAHCGGTMD